MTEKIPHPIPVTAKDPLCTRNDGLCNRERVCFESDGLTIQALRGGLMSPDSKQTGGRYFLKSAWIIYIGRLRQLATDCIKYPELTKQIDQVTSIKDNNKEFLQG